MEIQDYEGRGLGLKTLIKKLDVLAMKYRIIPQIFWK